MQHPEPGKITIVATSDNFFSVLLAALIKSVEVNHKSPEFLNFYIISDGISAANRRLIDGMIDSTKTSITWVPAKQAIPKGIKIPADTSSFPVATYLRLFAPYIIPQDVEKMIFLDTDMICTTEIATLWNTSIGDAAFGAVTDRIQTVSNEWGGISNYKELGIHPDTKYFNSGLLLINPIKWREEEVTQKVLKALVDNRDYVRFSDQYGLNVAMHNQWKELDARWNNFSSAENDDPYIIHFVETKPIFKDYNRNKNYQQQFFKYLQLTPWKDQQPIGKYQLLRRRIYYKLKNNLSRYFQK